MADLGANLPVPIERVEPTLEMRLKWLQVEKQQRISKLVHLNQALEDLLKGKVAEIEYAIMNAKAELAACERSEEMLKSSTDTTAI